MSKPTPSSTTPAPQVRRPATAQFPGLPSLLRSQSQAGPSSGAPAPGRSPASAIPSHLLGRSSGNASSSIGKGTPASKEKVALTARTSKTAKKFVALPEAVQSTPLPAHPGTQPIDKHATPPRADGHEADRREQENPDERSAAERMTKEERERNGFGRLTAYATAESYRLKSLAAFLKREHGAEVRIFDEAIYAVYTLPLLPGYGANVKVRSSPAVKSPGGGSILHAMDKAEETGYEGSYFAFEQTDPTPEQMPSSSPANEHGFHHVSTSPPVDLHLHHHHQNSLLTDQQLQSISSSPSTHHTISSSPPGPDSLSHNILVAPPPDMSPTSPTTSRPRPAFIPMRAKGPAQAEAIYFEYGVSVFFGFTETQEQDLLEDCENGGTWIGAFGELGQNEEDRGWEKEECHFLYDPTAQYPRIFNDLFTFKSSSHLLKLSLSHALAQSTKLSVYETAVQGTLADTAYIPKELALTGELGLDRREAVKLTGRLFKLRVEVNLVSNVLDTPELFWSEPSLTLLYEAVKEYLELEGRIAVLNEKLGVAGDLLEIIHEHVDNAGMHKVTIIIIWLIVVACFVEFGEVVARLVFHGGSPDTLGKSGLRLLAQSAGRSFRKY